ncbi:unnamed protein product [Thelazia callipaeda]|uniref:Uncharacterized protein n=1 Tax=Thelazia callipaeda TaxID=103827 RepID=A0A0N5CRL6_THECL|nr:unnamed protein product [Thelazia callipaeda]
MAVSLSGKKVSEKLLLESNENAQMRSQFDGLRLNLPQKQDDSFCKTVEKQIQYIDEREKQCQKMEHFDAAKKDSKLQDEIPSTDIVESPSTSISTHSTPIQDITTSISTSTLRMSIQNITTSTSASTSSISTQNIYTSTSMSQPGILIQKKLSPTVKNKSVDIPDLKGKTKAKIQSKNQSEEYVPIILFPSDGRSRKTNANATKRSKQTKTRRIRMFLTKMQSLGKDCFRF